MGYFIDEAAGWIGKISEPVGNAISRTAEVVRNTYERVSENVDLVGLGSRAVDGFYENVVAIPGLPPEAAWAVFGTSVALGVCTGGLSAIGTVGFRVAGQMLAKEAGKLLVKEVAKKAAFEATKRGFVWGGKVAVGTLLVGAVAFLQGGGGGESGGPQPRPEGGEPAVEEPPSLNRQDRNLTIEVMPSGYLIVGIEPAQICSFDQVKKWAEEELKVPGHVLIVLRVGAEVPEHLLVQIEKELNKMAIVRLRASSSPGGDRSQWVLEVRVEDRND